MKETIEHEKHTKIKGALFDLQKFTSSAHSRPRPKSDALRRHHKPNNTIGDKRSFNSTMQLGSSKVKDARPADRRKRPSLDSPLGGLKSGSFLDAEQGIINIFNRPQSSAKSNKKVVEPLSPDLTADLHPPLKPLNSKFGQISHARAPPENTTSGLSEFESIEPANRYPLDEGPKNTKQGSTNIYDQSAANERRQTDSRSSAILLIQRFSRGYIARRQIQKKRVADANNTAESVRKVPILDLKALSSQNSEEPYKEQSKPGQHQPAPVSSGRTPNTIFDHSKPFSHDPNRPVLPQDDMTSLPELIKIREQAIHIREEQEKNKLNQQLRQNKVSPRTF